MNRVTKVTKLGLGLQALAPQTVRGIANSLPHQGGEVYAAEDDVHCKGYLFEPFESTTGEHCATGMIQPLLPTEVAANPMLLREEVLPGINLMIGATGTLKPSKPGNGGFRIWNYSSPEAGAAEAVALAQGMEVKHMAYNTGCSGAKVVCDLGDQNLEDLDKQELLDALNKMLHGLDGSMFTGCDMNSTLDDMEYLASKSPYILAAIANDTVDPNAATAHGVVGAVTAVLSTDMHQPNLSGKRLLVHGCGAVGEVAAAELARMGATVFTLDVVPGRADIEGCTNISTLPEGETWWTMPVDMIVPCSKSLLITSEMVEEMQCQNIVGATNLPFANADAQHRAEVDHGINFVPEGISSAGAVIVDSVEQFDEVGFANAVPSDLYDWTRESVYHKTKEFCSVGGESCVSKMPAFLKEVSDRESQPVGLKFKGWRESRGKAPNSTKGPANNNAFGDGRRGLSSTASSSSDVVICGGGIMGLNIAYQLKLNDPSIGVTILERESHLGFGSSGWSTGFLRAFYSFDEQMELALDGINAYKNWADYTQIKDPSAYFTETGALWMLGKSASENEAMQTRLAGFGVDSTVLDPAALKELHPVLNTDPCPEYNLQTGELTGREFPELSTLHEKGCGHMDSSNCLEDIYKACIREGVDFRFNSGVASVLTDGDRASGVRLEDGSEVSGGSVINALGPWFQKLNDTAGVTTSTTMLPTRIQVGHLPIESEDILNLPFTADCHGGSGIYFMPRRANKQLVFGSIDHRFESEIIEDPDNFDTLLDADIEADYLGALLHRLPSMPTRGKVIGFSHMYTVNQEDVHPVVGPSAELSNFYLCNGHSGHGFKCAPAYGSLMAQQILNTSAAPDSEASRWQTKVRKDFLSSERSPLVMAQKTHFA